MGDFTYVVGGQMDLKNNKVDIEKTYKRALAYMKQISRACTKAWQKLYPHRKNYQQLFRCIFRWKCVDTGDILPQLRNGPNVARAELLEGYKAIPAEEVFENEEIEQKADEEFSRKH